MQPSFLAMKSTGGKLLVFQSGIFDKRTRLFGGWKGTNFIPALLTSVARLIVILNCLAAGHGFPDQKLPDSRS